jgi:hypothetical protein
MVTNKIAWALTLMIAAGAEAKEIGTPSSCQASGAQAPISNIKAALDRHPGDLRTEFDLADAWSDAGCFNEAVQVLQGAQGQHPANKDLVTRLRVARSLVGEQGYFESLDRADAEARLKRDTFRCTTLSDLDACSEASRMKPEDAGLLVAHADALARAKRPAEALARYRRAALLPPEPPDLAAKISAAEAQLPPGPPSVAMSGADTSRARGKKPDLRVARETAQAARQYSNAEQIARSH